MQFLIQLRFPLLLERFALSHHLLEIAACPLRRRRRVTEVALHFNALILGDEAIHEAADLQSLQFLSPRVDISGDLQPFSEGLYVTLGAGELRLQAAYLLRVALELRAIQRLSLPIHRSLDRRG